MKKRKVTKLHLPKETLLYLSWSETEPAVGGVTGVATCLCTKVCNTNTAKVGECCA